MKRFWGKKYVQEYSEKERFIRSQAESQYDEGYLEGNKEKQLDIAMNMLKSNFDNETISKITNLSIEEINQLKKD